MIYVLVFAGLCVFLGACWAVYVWAMRADDHRDPFAQAGLIVDAATVMDLGPMPPEIAHELPPLGDAVRHQYPVTSDQAPTRGVAQGRAVRVRARGDGGCISDPGPESRPAARADLTGSLTPRSPMEDPGSLARGGPGHASPAAPPLPLADYTGAAPGTAATAGISPPAPPPLPDPAYACANPTAYPLEWLESDTFVGGLTAIREMEET